MDNSDNLYWNMYGGGNPAKPNNDAAKASRDKMASRVIGGLKAQNAHTKTVDIGGELCTFPKAEYVNQLEVQLREARAKIRDLETKTQRLTKANNRIMESLRRIEIELANKIDLK